jgi:perosamine synthetase
MKEALLTKKSVLRKIKTLKEKPFGSTVTSGFIQGKPFRLILLTRECQSDRNTISLLAKWRKNNEVWFADQFPVTLKRTQAWFINRLIDTEDRLLFIIEVNDTYIGHVGLFRFDFRNRSCEIDNIVRGDKGYPGIIGAAITCLMRWGKDVLQLLGYTLETTSDNVRALRLYDRLGFIEHKRIPLRYNKTQEGGSWTVAPKQYKGSVKRYEVFMKQKSVQYKPSKKKISFAGPSITKKEVAYVIDGVKQGFYETFDQHIHKLEQAVASYTGATYALAGFCATHCLHLGCLVCGFKKGDEVIVTDISWAATAHVIAYTGATPVFVDVDPDTWCIDPKAIEKAITKKTKGIMLVHTFGHPAEMDEIMKIAKKYKLKVIEDAAPSLGSLYKGKSVGSIGDVGCFSFHGAKIAASGEGGMFLTNNKDMYDQAILFSNMGRTNRLANFWCDSIAYEYQMANVTAALALAQVERIEELVAMKRRIFDWYYGRLKDVPEIKLLKEKEYVRSNYAYPAALLLTDHISRNELVSRLKTYNIHGREAFPRMSRFPMYKARFNNPVATEVEKNGFNLPSAANITEGDVDYVCKVLISILRK